MMSKQKAQDDIIQHDSFRLTKFNIHHWQQILTRTKINPSPSAVRSSNKKYECNKCNNKFVHLSGLERHKSKFHGDDMVAKETEKVLYYAAAIKCNSCGAIFPNVEQYERHSLCFEWESILRSSSLPSECEDRWSSMFRNRLKIIAIGSAYMCEFCDTRFSDLPSLFYHESLHDPAEGFSCRFCQLSLPTLDGIVAHRISKPEDFKQKHDGEFRNVANVYCCNVCMNAFETLDDMYEHRFACNHFFPRKSRKLSQTANISGRRRLIDRCPICGYHTNNSIQLVEHYHAKHAKPVPAANNSTIRTTDTSSTRKTTSAEENIINETRPYLCEKCGKTYTQSSHLWQHLRFHNGVRPFVCTRYPCDRSFTIKPDLNDHIRKCHTGERPYKCETCDKRFLTGSVYYQHRLIHRGERRYGCSDCNKRFYRADALKNHQRIHTGERPYACDMCDRKFRQRGDREKHVRVKHTRIR